ncbi:hypothetical protein FSP39_015017 [Pinctada imbricata]|uniref:Uncharacterized protein n=1 Tax=Pinctada imbricata TaxID=66713 RepID=A0AA89C8X9_PINIB|nr:hypothetical protein FSP39_015017 [Pinctada imbricata]
MADAAVQREKSAFGTEISANDPKLPDSKGKGKKRAPAKTGQKSSDGVAIPESPWSVPSTSRDQGTSRPVASTSNAASTSSPRAHAATSSHDQMSEIVKMLNVIQQNQNKQDEKIDNMNKRVDEVYNSLDDFYEYDDSVQGYDDTCTNTDDSSDVPAAKQPRIDENRNVCDVTEAGTSNKFADAGKKLQVKEVIDEDVDSHLAKLINDWFHEGMEEDSYNDVTKKLTRPNNVSALKVVKTNQMVWDFLSPNSRTNDKKLQNVQQALIKGATGLTKLADVIGKSDNEEMSELLTPALESLAMFGHANRLICMFRREAMKPDMKGEYSHLCSHNLKFTDYLFGDDVPKTVKDISDCSKISNRVGIKNSFRGRPSYRGRGRGRFPRSSRGALQQSSSTYGAKNWHKRSWTQTKPSK